MPTKDITKAPDHLCTTAKNIAYYIERYKASRSASHYLSANTAIKDARDLLVDVEDLLRELSARHIQP